MRIATVILLIFCLPTMCRSLDAPTGSETWAKQVEEAESLRRNWGELTGSASGASSAQMIANLEAALKKYDSHPITPRILISLGELSENDSPERAEGYYVKAMTFPVASDMWRFAQQEATRRLAGLYERQQKFQQAAAILEDWKISEPCGTGASTSDARRWLKIWQLRLHFRPKNEVYADVWQAIAEHKLEYALVVNKEDAAARIRMMYGTAGVRRLKLDIKAFRTRESAEKHTAEFLDEIELQITAAAAMLTADMDSLAAQARDLEKRANVHGNLSSISLNVAWGNPQPLLPELLSEIKKRGTGAIPDLIRENEAHYSALILYSIASIGGRDAIDYLKQKATKEENVWSLKDYYYCLLATGDSDARKMIEEAAASTTKDNRPEAAKWALSALLPGQKWTGWRPYP